MQQTVSLQTPLGNLVISWTDGRLDGVRMMDGPTGPPGVIEGQAPGTEGEALVRAFQDYFSGVPAVFPDLAAMEAYTPFQQAVWRAAQAIPFGETRTYGALARTLGRPDAARAVGAALGKNPFLIVVPCHRVVGANGALTGFACGVEVKAALLEMEGARQKDGVQESLVFAGEAR